MAYDQKEYMRRYCAEHSAERTARAKAWNAANKDRMKQNLRHRLVKNRDELSRKAKEYARQNPEKVRAARARFMARNPWYDSWQGARQRCTNKKHPAYARYGGRGIKFMLSKADVQFMWTRDNAAAMDRPSIDRRVNDGPYSLDNCRFVETWFNSMKAAYDSNERRRQVYALAREKERAADILADPAKSEAAGADILTLSSDQKVSAS